MAGQTNTPIRDSHVATIEARKINNHEARRIDENVCDSVESDKIDTNFQVVGTKLKVIDTRN